MSSVQQIKIVTVGHHRLETRFIYDRQVLLHLRSADKRMDGTALVGKNLLLAWLVLDVGPDKENHIQFVIIGLWFSTVL